MANVIRHKRGTSDPAAGDFSETAELLVNTTDGGLFTKTDGGSVVEIGANADTLDGIDSGSFLRSDTADTATGLLTLSGGLVVDGSTDSGASDYAGYRSDGTNIVLKGDSSGRSAIFFQSEKDGTNINHPSDYAYIQFHPQGIGGSSGESAKLVVGVSNDAADTVVLQSPYKNGVKISFKDSAFGTGGSEYTVWHAGNDGAGSGLDADLLDGQQGSYYSPLASPTFTGTPAAPTASAGTNTTQVATTAFVQTAVANVVDSAPAALDTLNELAAALGDDANFSTTVTNSIAEKLPLSGGTMTGNLTMGTNYIYGNSAHLRVGSQAEFETVRNLTIIADNDNSSTSEALTLGAGLNSLVVTSHAGSTDNNKLTYNGNIVWHAGNDGSGTGLDADLWDGNQFSSYLNQALLTTSTASFDKIALTNNGNGTNVKIGDDAWLGDINLANTTRLKGVQNSANAYIVFGDSNTTALGRAGTGALTYGGNEVWHAGNDGTGSGLDADTVDGVQASSFLRADQSTTLSSGNLTLSSGNITANNGTNKQILINPGDGSIEITRAAGGAFIDFKNDISEDFDARLQESGGSIQLNGNRILTTADEGSGNGIDADTVDGVHASSFFQANNALSATTGAFSGDVTMSGTGALKVANGTTAQRPTAATGQIRYNTTLGALESYVQGAWQVIANTALDYGLITSASDTTFDYGALS